jgi:phosphatidylinositol alpha-1,6-mannosyltransferase
VILTVARLEDDYKGHDILIRALAIVRTGVYDVYYVIAGDGRLRTNLEVLAHDCGVADRVIFLGRVSATERLALYDRCDIFAMISREDAEGRGEGFGIVFLEAAARGKPSVGGRSGGIPDAVEDGVTGILVDPTDVSAVAEACAKLLLDHALAERLGSAGRTRVARLYTWEHVCQIIEDSVLGALLTERGPLDKT